jgi:hypothetical protein
MRKSSRPRRTILLAALAMMVVPALLGAQASPSGSPKDSAKSALIRQLLKEVRAADMAVTAMETSLPAQRAANPRIPAVFWDRFATLAHARVGQLEDILTVVYDRHFTTDELRQILAFYRSPIGHKLLDAQPSIMRESMLAGQEWGQRLGVEVAQQLAAEGIKIEP